MNKLVLILIFLLISPAVAISRESGPWTGSSSEDLITDAQMKYIYTEGEVDRTSEKVLFIIRCYLHKDGTPYWTNAGSEGPDFSLIFDWPSRIKTLKTRIDKGYVTKMKFSTESGATITNVKDYSGSFFKELLSGETLLFRAFYKYRGTKTIIFDISKLAQAIKPLSEACGWAK